jgi:uroporphyrinogen-III decarboxylase
MNSKKISSKTFSSRSRMANAMQKGKPDRVPVMCQLSIGHYLLNTPVTPARMWFSSDGFAEALVSLQRRYRFDGILINLPGHPEDWERDIGRIEERTDAEVVWWKDGSYTVCPRDDSAATYRKHPVTGEYIQDNRIRLAIDEVEIDRLFYESPHTCGGLKYPYFFYDIERGYRSPSKPEEWFPEYEFRTIELVQKATGGEVSIHGEFFSPFTQLMELLGYENALVALITHPEKSKAILGRYAEGCVYYGRELARRGVDAILMSSAFAGGGFISRQMYEEFVQPFEKACWDGIRGEFPAIPCYTHTCGAIGDRLDLMEATGLDGIDTLDPPPLGTVELDRAKEFLDSRVFIKGNIDSVNTLLLKNLSAAKEDIIRRIEWGKPGGAYILSTACSVAPRVEPDRLEMMVGLCEKYGKY